MLPSSAAATVKLREFRGFARPVSLRIRSSPSSVLMPAAGGESNATTRQLSEKRHGTLSARHWVDIRQAARLARTEGVTLSMHGVIVGLECSKENRLRNNSTRTLVRDERKPPMETVGGARTQPSKKQLRDMQRLSEFQEDKRAAKCGARWLPLVQGLLRRTRAKLRDQVWTGRMAQKVALKEKAGELLRRYVHKIRCAQAVRHDAAEPGLQAKDQEHVSLDSELPRSPSPRTPPRDDDDPLYSPDDRGERRVFTRPSGKKTSRRGRSRRR